ncbi:MAG: hypothetical protein E7266_05455 [Lachnospiraceae bacterium]|nr:hypothetical protein [Lachnospiraceae bacterium]
MNIQIIKNADKINTDIVIDNKIIVKETEPSEYENINLLRFYIYNLENNSKTEILPRLRKYDLGTAKSLQVNSKCLFFFNCIPLDDTRTEISVIKYDVAEDEFDTIYMFNDNISSYNTYKRMKMFVVNDYYIIVENEILRTNIRDTYEGYLDFELYLYKVRENEKVEIIDENIVNNGISDIIPIADNLCVVKTGFSLLKDARYNYLEKTEASVEGISFISPSQLVAELLLMKTDIILETIDKTFYTVTIPYVKKEGNYIIYSKVNIETKEEEVVFYNYVDKSVKCCVSKNVTDEKSLTKYNIIKNIPYIRLEREDKTSFYNLLSNKTEMSFPPEEKVMFVTDGFIVTQQRKDSFFTGKTTYTNVYRYPQKNLLHKEKGRFAGCVVSDKKCVYLLTTKSR